MSKSPLFVLLLVLAAPLCAEWHTDTREIMGTRVSVTLWHPDRDEGARALAAAMEEMRRIDTLYSPYKDDSDLSRVNRLAAAASADRPLAISGEMAMLLDMSLRYSQLTDGAFDITFASVGRHYDYRAETVPSDAQRHELLAAVDYRLVKLSHEPPGVFFADPRVYIDLGGIAKGYAVDRVLALLRERGLAHASVSAGGDSGLLGDRRGRPWMVGIKNPRNPEDTAIALPLLDEAISTSGDYERYFIDEAGERIHHIINPRTGSSADGIASASVIGPSALETDALSTSVFVLGVDEGMALLERLPYYEGIIITRTGKVHYSSGLLDPEAP